MRLWQSLPLIIQYLMRKECLLMTAIIKKFNLDPYVLDLSQIPKQVVAGQRTLFSLNLFDKSGNVWLWHSDYHIAIRDSKGQPLAVFPNNHGHGSVIQFEYIFPKEGVYTIGMIFGQQTGSPNFMVEPHLYEQQILVLMLLHPLLLRRHHPRRPPLREIIVTQR